MDHVSSGELTTVNCLLQQSIIMVLPRFTAKYLSCFNRITTRASQTGIPTKEQHLIRKCLQSFLNKLLVLMLIQQIPHVKQNKPHLVDCSYIINPLLLKRKSFQKCLTTPRKWEQTMPFLLCWKVERLIIKQHAIFFASHREVWMFKWMQRHPDTSSS